MLTYIVECGHLRRVKLSLLANDIRQETGKQPKAAVELFGDGCVVLVPANILIKYTGPDVLTEQDGRKEWAWPQYV